MTQERADHIYLIGYDIRDERRWRNVYKTLWGFGRPIQYSVFRCVLSPTRAAKLRHRMLTLVADEDDVFFARLCPSCETRLEVHGRHENDDVFPGGFRIH